MLHQAQTFSLFTFTFHQEILAVARSIKDEVDPAALSLSGARLLQLLEPFLESLVPVEVVVMATHQFMFQFPIMSLTQ